MEVLFGCELDVKAVLLLSGGLDSYTAGALAREQGYGLYALTLGYGQVHDCERNSARQVARDLAVARHIELNVDLASLVSSSLTGSKVIPKDRALDDHEIPTTYVPARNTVMLALALAWAEDLGAQSVFIGVNALDYSGYPDCRPQFIKAFERVAALGTRAGVEGGEFKILAPLIEMSKAAIIRCGTSLGLDYSLTHSCYDPGASGSPCGLCDSCRLRARGFAEAGIRDPLLGGE